MNDLTARIHFAVQNSFLNNDIVCKVRSGTKGSTVASSIKWVVDNGAEVEEGEKVMELDDSGLKEALKSQNIVLDGAQANEVLDGVRLKRLLI